MTEAERLLECAERGGLAELDVSVVRFAMAYFPGIVECRLRDAHGALWTFVEKGPVVSLEYLDAFSAYPRPGSLRCRVLRVRVDALGRALVAVDTASPWSIESVDGIHLFEVLPEQLRVVTEAP